MPINDWLEDAPMPDCYNVPSTSTDENNDPFPFSNMYVYLKVIHIHIPLFLAQANLL